MPPSIWTPGRQRGRPGTSHAAPLHTKDNRDGITRQIDCSVRGTDRYTWVEFFREFLWDEDPTATHLDNLYEHTPAGAATMGAVEDGVDGQLQIQASAEDQFEVDGYSWKDDLKITATGRVLFECIFSPVTLPAAGQSLVLGLGGALAPAVGLQNLDSIARRLWFKWSADGVTTLESDDGTTDRADQVPSQNALTIVAGSWYLARIDAWDTGEVVFEMGPAGKPEELMILGTLAASALAASDKLQPLALTHKDSGVGQPEILLDMLYCRWLRRWDK